MGVKIKLRIITKNHAADQEIGFLKIGFKVVWWRNVHADSVGVNLSVRVVFGSVSDCGKFHFLGFRGKDRNSFKSKQNRFFTG